MIREKLNCIMLIDDDQSDNYYHQREIKKADLSIDVLIYGSAEDALDYLKSMKKKKNIQPDMIFLDINMPEMDGWGFLSEFSRLDIEIQDNIMIMMLTTSKNPTDKFRAKAWSFVSGFLNKPLTKKILEDIIETYFK